MTLPSVLQMANRAQGVHRRLLRAISEGRRVTDPSTTDADWRGFRTALATLRRWDTVADGALTERGRLLLAELDLRAAR